MLRAYTDLKEGDLLPRMVSRTGYSRDYTPSERPWLGQEVRHIVILTQAITLSYHSRAPDHAARARLSAELRTVTDLHHVSELCKHHRSRLLF